MFESLVDANPGLTVNQIKYYFPCIKMFLTSYFQCTEFEITQAYNRLGDKNTTVLNLAMDSINLGLCDSDYFAGPLLIVQTD